MRLFQIYYEDPVCILDIYVAAADLETAIERFRRTFSFEIVQIFERSKNLLS